MSFIYRNGNWVKKISLLVVSIFLSFNLATISLAQTGKITGTFTASPTANSALIVGSITNSQKDLADSASKLKLTISVGGSSKDSDFLILNGGNFTATLNGLTPGTEYKFQIYDTTGRLSPTDLVTFKTFSNIVNAAVTTNVWTDHAEVSGYILNNNFIKLNLAIKYGIKQKDGSNKFDIMTDPLVIDGKTGAFATVTLGSSAPLNLATNYQYEIIDREGNLSPSPVVDFKTGGENQVLAGANAALDVNSVKISGQILNDMKAAQYWTLQIDYGVSDFSLHSSTFKVDKNGNFFLIPLTGLKAGTTYQYRISLASSSPYSPSEPFTLTTLTQANSILGGGGGSNSGQITTNSGNANSGQITTNNNLIHGLENPLQINTLAEFVKKILDIVITIGIPIIALFIIYSGFLFVKAQGDPKELETAKATFLWTVVGAAILLASWILAQAICKTVLELGNSSTQCQ